jgi:hypothetical protein
MEVYLGTTLALTVANIGVAAGLEVNEELIAGKNRKNNSASGLSNLVSSIGFTHPLQTTTIPGTVRRNEAQPAGAQLSWRQTRALPYSTTPSGGLTAGAHRSGAGGRHRAVLVGMAAKYRLNAIDRAGLEWISRHFSARC